MGHDKLRKFAENETFACLLQPSAQELLADGYFALRDHSIKGHWAERMFAAAAGSTAQAERPSSPKDLPSGKGSSERQPSPGAEAAGGRPLTLELGCGKGEYTIDLARRCPEGNYVGVDIKGARLWRGAKTATEAGMRNVAFLRTRIEFITAFFAPGEVSQIWLTFSDPQLKSENNRLTSPLFLERYRRFLRPGGVVHLKTDSRFLHEYTRAVVRCNGLRLLCATTDLYGDFTAAGGSAQAGRPSSPTDPPFGKGSSERQPSPGAAVVGAEYIAGHPELTEVQTFYERMFRSQGYPITYMAFTLDHEGAFVYPEDFDAAYWRSVEGPRRFKPVTD